MAIPVTDTGLTTGLVRRRRPGDGPMIPVMPGPKAKPAPSLPGLNHPLIDPQTDPLVDVSRLRVPAGAIIPRAGAAGRLPGEAYSSNGLAGKGAAQRGRAIVAQASRGPRVPLPSADELAAESAPPPNPKMERRTRSQESVMRDRAVKAHELATHAESGPMPTDPHAAAGRKAYIARQKARANINSGGYFTDEQMRQDENARINSANEADVAARRFEVDRGQKLLPHEVRGAELQNLAGDAVLPHVGPAAAASVRQAEVAAESTAEQRKFVESELKASRDRVRHLEIQAGKRTPGAAPKRMSGRDLTAYFELISEEQGEAAAEEWLQDQIRSGQADQQDEAPAAQPADPLNGMRLRVPVPIATDRTTTVTRPPPGYGTPVPSAAAPAAQPAAQPRGPMIPVPSVGANAAGYSALTAPPAGTPQVTARRPLTPQVAAEIFAEAGYDRERAKQLAEARGYDHAAR